MKKLTRGIFIVFCGPEGGGKSTQIAWLSEQLTKQGYDVLATNEQRATKVGKKIRDVIQSDLKDGLTEFFLFCAARRYHVVNTILPALNTGRVVICDRYVPDTYAYQCVGRTALRTDEFKFIMDRAVNDVYVPDLCIWMDLDPSIGLKRKMEQGAMDRFESENLSFHEAVARGFGTFFSTWTEYAHVRIDATKSKKHTHRKIMEHVQHLLRPCVQIENPAS